MGAAWAWARSRVRRRWGSTAALALLIGVSGAVVLTAAAGARRTESAFDRALAEARTADVRLQYSSEEPVDDDVLAALRAHPDVEVAAPVFFTLGSSPDSEYDLAVLAGPDPALFAEVDRPQVIDGRMPDPAAADQVVVNRFASEALGVSIGDVIHLATLTPAQLEGEEFAEPAGPALSLTVVGVTRLPDDVADAEFPGIYGTPAFHEATWGRAAGYGPSIEVRVRPGADAEAVVADAIEGLPLDEVEMTSRAGLAAQVTGSTHAMALGLAAFAAAAGLAALVAGAQALHRQLADAGGDQITLLAVGLTARQRAGAALLTVVPAVLGGAALAIALAIAASPLMPVGVARLAEPHRGVAVDAGVLGLGTLAMVAALAVVAVASTARVVRTAASGSRLPTIGAGRPARLGRLLRAGSSAPTHLGITMAVEPGTGASAVPVRSAIAGAVLGLAGVVAALTFGASLVDLGSSPDRYGWAWTLAPDTDDASLTKVAELDGVRDVGLLVHRQVVVNDEQVLGIAVDAVAGSPTLTVRQGRMPTTADEVAVGPLTADRWGVEVGDDVLGATPDGAQRLTVVGEVLFPVFNENPFNDGVAVHPDAIDALGVSEGFAQPVVTFDDGISPEQAARQLEAVAPDSTSIYAFASPPPDVANVEGVRSLPLAMAVFLSLLAVAAVGHAVATSVRRRRHDLGTVRALGFVRWQVRYAVTVQAAALLAAGILVGVPAGIAVGRLAWRALAAGLGVEAAPVVPVSALVAIAPIGALLAVALAALPGRAAARLRAVDALRSE